MNSFSQSVPSLHQLLGQNYGLDGQLHPLPGEYDLNFRLDTPDNQSYTVKIAHPQEKEQYLDLQNALMAHLEHQDISLELPRLITDRSEAALSKIKDDKGQERFLRVLSWAKGRLFANVQPKSPELLESLGIACGTLCSAMNDFDHPAAHRKHKWDLAQAEWITPHLHLFQGKRAEWIRYFFDLFKKNQPTFQSLRQSVIYNDANDYNILVSEDIQYPTVQGFIDFGDVVFTQTVNEPAIAMAYGIMDKPQPLEEACRILKGFHQAHPLQEKEVSLLYSLVATRLILSLTVSAINKKEHPENEYLQISEQPAWALLEKWRNIPPALAHYAFREACGWEPCPQKKLFDQWIQKHPHDFPPVIRFNEALIAPLDLSVGSLDLGNNSNFDHISTFQQTIDRMLDSAGAAFGIGGYGETRPVYTTDAYLVKGNEGPQWRTVHLGIDVWGPADTPVYAPLEGIIHSFQNNAQERDYGPTIILEHRIDEQLSFYTLYGHLSLSSLEGWEKGQKVEKGQQIATIGPTPENGNWPPHLHFQVMLDMLDQEGDFPGVGFPEQKKIWLSICPSGAPFLNTNVPAGPNEQMHQSDILSVRKKNLGKSLSISYNRPLHMVRGYGQYLYDQTGRRYLDTVNNVAHVGHEHPKVVQAGQRQMAVLNTNTRYLHENIVRFAEELLATFPPQLNVVHFVNSGSEANELALRMAHTCTGQKDMLVVEVGYHGNTTGCIDISSYKFDGKGGKGAPDHIHVVPIPDTYRGLYRNDPDAGSKYAGHIRQAIEKVQAKGKNIGGFFCESILSCGGQVVLPDNYLREAFQYVRAAGGLCIMDEVQVGFGRVGEHFWGFELQGVIPDIVTMGKPIGNGHPLGAVVTTEAVAREFANGMEFFSTFGGNPVSCAIGNAVLQVVKEEGLQDNAGETGRYLTQGLKGLQQYFPIIGDVRGPGLFLGFELVTDTEQKTPATRQAAHLANRMRAHGVLMSTDGPYNNVLKIKPPLCFNRKNADFLIETLHAVLQEDFFKL